MSKITNRMPLLALGGALFLWIAATSLSVSLSGNKYWLGGTPLSATVIPTSSEKLLDNLRSEANLNPTSAKAWLEFGLASQEQGLKEGRAELIIEAIDAFQRVLALDPKQPDAILNIANISAEMGVFDKAQEFYSRYLADHPDDSRVVAARGFIELKMGNNQDALKTFTQLSADLPSDVSPKLGLGMSLAALGEKEQARTVLTKALSLARTEDSRKEIQTALSGLDGSSLDGAGLDKQENPPGFTDTSPTLVSPANEIVRFFSEHQIVGSKIEQLSWIDGFHLDIEVSDFPVDQMPPFALEKLKQSVTNAFSSFDEEYIIRLRDNKTQKLLIEFKVGKIEK